MNELYGLIANVEGMLYLAASFVYLMLALLLFIAWRRSGPGTWLVFACLATVLWASLYSAGFLVPDYDTGAHVLVLESARALAWTGFIFSIFQSEGKGARHYSSLSPGLAPTLVASLVIVLNIMLTGLGGAELLSVTKDAAVRETGFLDKRLILHISSAVGVLLLLEMLIRRSSGTYRSGIFYLVMALGGQTLFDLLMFAGALFSGMIDPAFMLARPGIAIMVAPFLCIAASRNSD